MARASAPTDDSASPIAKKLQLDGGAPGLLPCRCQDAAAAATPDRSRWAARGVSEVYFDWRLFALTQGCAGASWWRR